MSTALRSVGLLDVLSSTRTVEYACGALGRAPCVHARLRHLATKPGEKSGLVDFATVAGGHNFRPHRTTRLKYRYYHQHRGFVEAYDEPKCVGCGRCSQVCLASIHLI